MKILVQSVGTGGPDNPVWEALALVLKNEQPDHVLWVCSELTERETLPKVIASCKQLGVTPPAEPTTLILENEDQVEKVINKLQTKVDELREEFPDAEFIADYTSGTKAMSAAVVAVSIGRRLNRLLYGTGPRDESGRAIRTDSIISVATDAAYADLLLSELGRLFNIGQFEAVRHQALALLPSLDDETLKARAASLAFLSYAYDHWQRFNWDKAFDLIHSHKNISGHKQLVPWPSSIEISSDALFRTRWDVEKIGKQNARLKRCKEGNCPLARLSDLWANAERTHKAGRHDDAVARLYRLIEYIGQMRYCKLRSLKWNTPEPTSNVDADWIRENAPDYAKGRAALKDKDNKLGSVDTFLVTAEAGDPVSARVVKEYNMNSHDLYQKSELGTLLNKRNESLLAHGVSPIGAESAAKLLVLSRQILDWHAKDVGQDLDLAIEESTFVSCPWVT
ncbi:TIGR02710 family CRISPR-associated CARF protein [Botrimarina hoheduenensis]|uniref:CRISPR-associated protein n=1 Tax=Botrimarina hoheduenensis TaxID=2528000 RepID=A0A5C5VN09_9BACT|nr:TIGR02710 family CRISPR-associated CARF protein [Botrimarina hoheduenensis]TWT40046.1 CRISPR-associated protein [Botrimarina hoheduenensis]